MAMTLNELITKLIEIDIANPEGGHREVRWEKSEDGELYLVIQPLSSPNGASPPPD